MKLNMTVKTTDAISEFERIIQINHKVSGDIKSILTDIYNKGIEIGNLKGLFRSEFYSTSLVEKFDMEKMLVTAIQKLNPERISNNRNIKYNGTEITHNSILVCDFNVNQVINLMTLDDSDYMYFEKHRFEKDYFDTELKNSLDEEDKADIIKEYNTLEVRIFLMKCYQVGFSVGATATKRIPHGIVDIFKIEKEISDCRSDKDIENLKETAAYYKQRNPDWQNYAKYFK